LSDNIYNDWSETLMKLLIYCRLTQKENSGMQNCSQKFYCKQVKLFRV